MKLRLAFLCCFLFSGAASAGESLMLSPRTMPRVATVDPRFQSYNVEMIEVTGGWFWRPYADPAKPASVSPPPGVDPARYAYRPPIDLDNRRLRRLAAALGPAYVRVSGTWANTTHFGEAGQSPPPGFRGVVTRAQWRGVVGFARAVAGDLVTSVAIGTGTRNAAGDWTPEEARRVFATTQALGGRIAAAEFMNEPNYPALGDSLPSYSAEGFGRDIAAFKAFLRQASPGTRLVGPGSAGEDMAGDPPLGSRRLLAAAGPAFDVFSYHYYPIVSERCGQPAPEPVARERGLSEDWLARTEGVLDFYAGLRDRFASGRPIWITETAEAACGGNRWATTFLDSFRYLDQLGRLARRGVQAVFHNTLAASDYGLLDEATFAPRPNYWAALLWRRLMGTIVLDAGPDVPGVRLYAHCLRGHSGGVAAMAINFGTAEAAVNAGSKVLRYTLDADSLTDRAVRLNGKALALAGDRLPAMPGAPASAVVGLPPHSITFLAVPQARNPACR